MLKRVRYLRILLALFLIIPAAIFASVKGSWPIQLGGYKAVRVHYGPLNKMIMPVNINGQPANLLVDTGSSHVMLDADTAVSFGIKPSQRGLRYIRFNEINGQELPLGFAQNLTAGSMSFGSILITLRNSSYSSVGGAHIDGVLGHANEHGVLRPGQHRVGGAAQVVLEDLDVLQGFRRGRR